jgi:hypothetical protein
MGDTVLTTPSFVLSRERTEAIAGWKAEKARLENIVTDANRGLNQVNEKLQAAGVLAGQNGESSPSGVESSRAFLKKEKTLKAANLTRTVERIANESAGPMAKNDLKEILVQQGFPKERLSTYFYTAITRLKHKGRITVRADGSLWRGRSPNAIGRGLCSLGPVAAPSVPAR